jgi:hypothetical protein
MHINPRPRAAGTNRILCRLHDTRMAAAGHFARRQEAELKASGTRRTVERANRRKAKLKAKRRRQRARATGTA